MRSFCRKTHVHKILRFRGGALGGGECRFYFYGRADFSEKSLNSLESLENGRILFCFPQSGGSLETPESISTVEFEIIT